LNNAQFRFERRYDLRLRPNRLSSLRLLIVIAWCCCINFGSVAISAPYEYVQTAALRANWRVVPGSIVDNWLSSTRRCGENRFEGVSAVRIRSGRVSSDRRLSEVFERTLRSPNNESSGIRMAPIARGLCIFSRSNLPVISRYAVNYFPIWVDHFDRSGAFVEQNSADKFTLYIIHPSREYLTISVLNENTTLTVRYNGDFSLFKNDSLVTLDRPQQLVVASRANLSEAIKLTITKTRGAVPLVERSSSPATAQFQVTSAPIPQIRLYDRCSQATTLNVGQANWACNYIGHKGSPEYLLRKTADSQFVAKGRLGMIYLRGGPRILVEPQSIVAAIPNFTSHLEWISFPAYELTGELSYGLDFPRSAEVSMRQISSSFARFNGQGKRVIVVADSLSAQLLDDLSAIRQPLDIILVSSALDGYLVARQFWNYPNDHEQMNTRMLDDLHIQLNRNFENGFYHWLVRGRHDPLEVLCKRNWLTRIVVIHGLKDQVTPFSIRTLERRLKTCQNSNIQTQLMLLNTADHSPNLLERVDLTSGLISDMLNGEPNRS
jgi:hypothetical protein